MTEYSIIGRRYLHAGIHLYTKYSMDVGCPCEDGVAHAAVQVEFQHF